MLRVLASSLVAAVAIQFSLTQAISEESLPWGSGEVNGWSIAVDTTIGNGCFIASTFDGYTVVRIGFSPEDGGLYFMIGDLDWKSIEEGKEYDVVLQMGNKPEWTAPARGLRMGDIPMLLVRSSDVNFVEEFSSQHYVRLWFDGAEIANLSLEGSAGAIAEMVQCQLAINESYVPASGNRTSSDPFAESGGSSARDPFAR